MKEDKTTQDFLQSAYDVLSGNVKSFHQQAQEEYYEMWLNDEIQLEDTDQEKLVDLYTQFENNEISEKELEEGILGAIGRGIKKGAKRLSTQGRTDAAKKKIKKLKAKSDAKKKKIAQKSALKRTKSALSQAKKKYK